MASFLRKKISFLALLEVRRHLPIFYEMFGKMNRQNILVVSPAEKLCKKINCLVFIEDFIIPILLAFDGLNILIVELG